MSRARFQRTRSGVARVYGGLVFSGAIAILSGCAEPGDSGAALDPLGRVIQPIIRGTNSGTDGDSVVVLATYVGSVRDSFCSATVVAPNLLLTARHCVTDISGPAGCSGDGQPSAGTTTMTDRDPGSLRVFVGANGVSPDTTVEANAVARGSKLVVDGPTPMCDHDIALVILDKAVSTPVASIRLGTPTTADKVAAVGWGVGADGLLPAARQVRADLPLLGIGPGAYPQNPDYGYGHDEFITGEGACAGDSGGPALASTGAVVGVASRTNNGKAADYNNYAATCVGDDAHVVYTQLLGHKDLVLRGFSEAGATPTYEKVETPAASAPPGAAAGAKDNAAAPPVETLAGEGSLPKLGSKKAPQGGAGGCSMTNEPQKDNVQYVAGLVGLIALLASVRRFLGKKKDEPSHRERLPSLP